jgi:hypothetical protein
MVQLNFDARQFTPLDNDVIPEGWYNFIIDESNAMPTKDGNPNHLRLVLRFSIIDGPHQGRKVFTGLNMRHTNIQTMEIANRELSAICAALNLPYVQDTQQLHNIPLKGRVKTIKDPNGVYDDKSEIKSYKPINYVVPGVLAQPGTKPQGAPAAAPTGWTPQQAPQQAPQQTWAPPQQQAPQQNGVYQQPPQQQAAPPNGGWQQPQTQQPWGQPPQQAPQQMQAPVQTQPVQQAEPQQAPVQQSAPVGFAAPPPTQQAPQAVQQPQDPAVTAAQTAQPPWARQPS